MRSIITFSLFILLSISSLLGKETFKDVVYLKNGSIIKGIIIEQVPNESIKIETGDKSIFVFNFNEIEKIAKEIESYKENSIINNGTGQKKGYKGIVELGYQIGTGNYATNRLKLNVINGYQIIPQLSIGFGTGLRYYHELEGVIIPFFVDLRTNFFDNKMSPYFSLGLGYSIEVTGGVEGVGFLFNPIIGGNFKINNRISANVGLGYEAQMLRFYDYYWGYYDSVNLGGFEIVVGFSF